MLQLKEQIKKGNSACIQNEGQDQSLFSPITRDCTDQTLVNLGALEHELSLSHQLCKFLDGSCCTFNMILFQSIK